MKIECKLCSAPVHSIAIHLKQDHPEVSIESYAQQFPDSPLLSDEAKMILERKKVEKATAPTKREMHVVFKLSGRKILEAKDVNKNPILVDVLPRTEHTHLIPDVDSNYVLNVGLLKNVMMGFELNVPVYLWGHAGVGKSTLYEQICAFTNRPYIRVQHTINTEEAHIVGQILANESGTYFEPGPLTLAMRHGWVYNADEYDFAHASVLSVYQSVLEGKSLVIKEAPPEWRIVHPHPNFRFVATGNTNGSGDESGLYQGTNLGNAANYSRFGVTCYVDYLPSGEEAKVVSKQGSISLSAAKNFIDLASAVRNAFGRNETSSTIGTRELINAAKIAGFKAKLAGGVTSAVKTEGFMFAYVNRLSPLDKEVVTGLMQRILTTEPAESEAQWEESNNSTSDTVDELFK